MNRRIVALWLISLIVLLALLNVLVTRAQDTPLIISGTDSNEAIADTDVTVFWRAGTTEPREVNLMRLETLMRDGRLGSPTWNNTTRTLSFPVAGGTAVDIVIPGGTVDISGKLDRDLQNFDANDVEKAFFLNGVGALNRSLTNSTATSSQRETFRQSIQAKKADQVWPDSTSTGVVSVAAGEIVFFSDISQHFANISGATQMLQLRLIPSSNLFTRAHLPKVTAAEITAGTSAESRAFSPQAVHTMIDTHGAQPGMADGVADSLDLSVSGETLTATIGRSIGVDLTDSVTLPTGGGGGVTAAEVDSKIATHNTSNAAHQDIRTTIANLDLGEDNVQSDWNESDMTNDAFIRNKPTIPTDTDNIVDSVDMSLSGQTLTLTLGRTGTYADLSDTITLPGGGTGTSDYNALSNRPIINIATTSNLPTASSSNVGHRYQTNDGKQWRNWRHVIHGETRVVNWSVYTSTNYQGALNSMADLPATVTSADEGKWWLIRSNARDGIWPFIRVDSIGSYQSQASVPDSVTYLGVWRTEAYADSQVTAAGQVAVYPVSNVYNLYRVDSDFVPGTPTHTTYGWIPTDVDPEQAPSTGLTEARVEELINANVNPRIKSSGTVVAGDGSLVPVISVADVRYLKRGSSDTMSGNLTVTGSIDVQGSMNIAEGDVPGLPASKITSGDLHPQRLANNSPDPLTTDVQFLSNNTTTTARWRDLDGYATDFAGELLDTVPEFTYNSSTNTLIFQPDTPVNSDHFKGDWDSTETYSHGDLVEEHDQYWIAHDSTLFNDNRPGGADGQSAAETTGWEQFSDQAGFRGRFETTDTTSYVFHTGDQITIAGVGFFFCTSGGNYTVAQIQSSAAWTRFLSTSIVTSGNIVNAVSGTPSDEAFIVYDGAPENRLEWRTQAQIQAAIGTDFDAISSGITYDNAYTVRIANMTAFEAGKVLFFQYNSGGDPGSSTNEFRVYLTGHSSFNNASRARVKIQTETGTRNMIERDLTRYNYYALARAGSFWFFVGGTRSALGTAAYRDVGTGNDNVPELNASGDLADSVIPNLSASKITSGTLPVARGGTGATTTTTARTALGLGTALLSFALASDDEGIEFTRADGNIEELTRAQLQTAVGLGSAPTVSEWTRDNNALMTSRFVFHTNITPPTDKRKIKVAMVYATGVNHAAGSSWVEFLYSDWNALSNAAADNSNFYADPGATRNRMLAAQIPSFNDAATLFLGKTSGGLIAVGVVDGGADPDERGVRVYFED